MGYVGCDFSDFLALEFRPVIDSQSIYTSKCVGRGIGARLMKYLPVRSQIAITHRGLRGKGINMIAFWLCDQCSRL